MSRATDLIKGFEGFSLTAYKDVAGVWTIGWGTTGPDIYQGLVWTESQCELRLQADAALIEIRLGRMLLKPPTPCQLAALVSFIYNEGLARFADSSIRNKLNGRDILGAADAFLLYDKAHIAGVKVVVPDLVSRRAKERLVFLGMPA